MKQTFNMKWQLSVNLRYCYLSRRATQNISASRSLPTIGFKPTCHGLPLSVVAVPLHYLPRCLPSTVTCGKTATTETWSAPLKKCCHVIVTQQRLIVEQFAPGLRNLHLKPKERIEWTAFYDGIIPEQWTDSCAMWVSHRQINCHRKN